MPAVVDAVGGARIPQNLVRARGRLTFDVAGLQVLLHYPAHPIPGHHRLPLLALGGSRWIIATANGDFWVEDFEEETVTPLLKLWRFKGPSATEELVGSIAASGSDPTFFVTQWEIAVGLPPRTAVAIELRHFVFGRHLTFASGTLDVCHLSAAEHLSRRALEIQRAVRRNPPGPLFEGLVAYLAHMGRPA